MARKQYADATYYERKLDRVIERLGAEDHNYNFDRHGAWVEFRYKGELYRFDHTVEQARENGQDIAFGSDCFAQIVLAIQDISRIVERGIYDLSTWVSGLRFLPPPTEIPKCFQILGFQEMPDSVGTVRSRFRNLAKQYHSDTGGEDSEFMKIKTAAEQAVRHMEAK